jgi:hypothetical protein
LFVAGAPKCGTTSLYHYLKQHPNIYMSPIKEPRFWGDDLRAQGKEFHRGLYRRQLLSVRNAVTLPYCYWKRRNVRPERLLGIESFDRYLRLFDGADPRVHRYFGEASTDSMWSKTAAGRIADACPGARVIIMLREPVSYVRSIHQELLRGRVGETVRSLDRALGLEDLRRKGVAIPCTVRYPFTVYYRLQARFDEQVERFLNCFDRERIHFILLDDLAKDADGVMRGVFEFLSLPLPTSSLDLSPKNAADSTGGPHLSHAWRRRLVEEFRPVVSKLQEQTGFPLVERWGYQQAGDG